MQQNLKPFFFFFWENDSKLYYILNLFQLSVTIFPTSIKITIIINRRFYLSFKKKKLKMIRKILFKLGIRKNKKEFSK